MALKLYYGGFGEYKEFVVADSEEQAVLKVGIKLNAPFLPVTVEEISVVDGYQIIPNADESPKTVEIPNMSAETKVETEILDVRHCKKCDFTCETQGQLLLHYRENHPKGD